MTDVPQVLVNARVKSRAELKEIPGYEELIAKVRDRLKGRGRVFVRFSGTEPVARVLVEGPDKRLISTFAEEIANLIQSNLGR